MRGDILDTKHVLATVLRGQGLLDALTAVVAEKRLLSDNIPNPVELRNPSVFTEEWLSKQLFPQCELLGFSTTYAQDETVKQATHRIGMRWTAMGKDEETATLSVELLCTATVELFWNPLYGGYLADYGLHAGSVNVLEEDYSPLLPDPQQTVFIKGGVVIVELTTYRS